MARRKRKKISEARQAKLAAERRRTGDARLERIDRLAEQVLLGLDDGTEEAALNESIDFDKYIELLDEDAARGVERRRILEQDAPGHEQQRKFREPNSNFRVSWRNK